MTMSMFRRILFLAPIAIAAMQSTFAASPTVTAVLSNSQPTVGQIVQLEIKISGANKAKVPESISVDGLEIHQTGQMYESSLSFGFGGNENSSSATYTYSVLPLKAGQFNIPPQTVRVGSDSLRTPELVLNVAQGSRSSAGSSQSGQTQAASKLAFAELVVAKKDAYVGEMVPAEIRLGFDPRARGRLQDGPELSGQGFTTQKLQQPRENLETIGGRTYQVYTFKTAIAAARPGKFEIGPVTAKAVVVLPRRPSAPRTTRPRSPFDLFNLDDPFSDPFFSDPFGSMGERTELPIRSETATLNVKPLPTNAPPNFSGAIGNFTMAVDAKPKTVQVGDPITVTSTINGRGNFDRMNGPALEDERGWHKYPPSSKFKQDDDVGISGEKTFEMVVSPNEKKQSLPPLAFSYFDPTKEQYVTLHSEPTAITVQGSATAPNVAAQQPSSSPVTAARGRPPVPNSTKPQDILYQLTEPSRTAEFKPLYARRGFWAAQSLPFAALLFFAGWKIRRARLDDREARRISALQHEAAQLMHKLRHDDASPREYYSEASRIVRLKAALASGNRGIDPNVMDAEKAADTFKLDTEARDRLRRLFEQNDEWQYSGTHNGPGRISPENRRDVLELIENLG